MKIFPRQGRYLGKRIEVTIHYNNEAHVIMGNVIREDVESPYVMLIRLDTGNYILSTECTYKFVDGI